MRVYIKSVEVRFEKDARLTIPFCPRQLNNGLQGDEVDKYMEPGKILVMQQDVMETTMDVIVRTVAKLLCLGAVLTTVVICVYRLTR